jgi:hypothetical protein
MSEHLRRAIYEVEHGELRPQFNPGALTALADLSGDWKLVEPILIDRLFQLSRLIADASAGAGEGMRLQDASRFFNLIQTLTSRGYPGLVEMLRIVLDEFSQLTERSYDELFLWCIVQLSRADQRFVQTFWPQAIALDLRYRAAPWRRPAGTRLFEQPYRFTDLILYYYEIYTLNRDSQGVPLYPGLSSCLVALAPDWKPLERNLVLTALQELKEEVFRPVFSDALGLLKNIPHRRHLR